MSKGTMNKVILVGRLGSEPELKTTPSGFSIATISIATVESRKKDNQYEDHTTWHKVKVLGKTAEFINNYASKGSQVLVDGKINNYSIDAEDGTKKYFTEVVANSVELLSKSGDVGANTGQQHNKNPAPKAQEENFNDDDMPF